MIIALTLIFGIMVSAFFSGMETGFYRVTRVRLALDAKAGSWIAKANLWLLNRPSVVVASLLIGNNLANYLVSFGLVLLGQILFSSWDQNIQAILPILMTPVLFVYGELLPKYLFYHSPYSLFSRLSPLLLLCVVLFLPVALLVMLLEKQLVRLLGQQTGHVGNPIEGQELQRVLVEGHEAGLLQPIQRELTQNVFTFGVRQVRQFMVPVRALPMVGAKATREQILAASDRMGQPIVLVLDEQQNLVGFHHLINLLILPNQVPVPSVSLKVDANETCTQVLTHMHAAHTSLAHIEDQRGRTIGVVTRQRLAGLLLPES